LNGSGAAGKAIWVLANTMKIMDEKRGRQYNSQIKKIFSNPRSDVSQLGLY
jgi:hypothetical protein